MAFTQSTIRTQFASLIDVSPNKLTVTIGADDYDAVKSNLNREIAYSDWGVDNNYRFSVMLSVSDFDTLPEVHTTVTLSGTTYRILNIEKDSNDITVKFDLGEEYA